MTDAERLRDVADAAALLLTPKGFDIPDAPYIVGYIDVRSDDDDYLRLVKALRRAGYFEGVPE